MKKLDVSSVTGAAGLPIKSGTLTHIQLAYQEALTSLVLSFIGKSYNPTATYVVSGCVNTGSGLNYIISAGSVFINGEIYQVAAATFTASTGQVAIGNITTTFFTDPTADPVLFTDLVPRSVHQIRTVTFSAGTSGTGTAGDFSAMQKANSAQLPIRGVSMYLPASGSLSEFDATGKGITNNTLGWAICNGSNGTVDLSGKFVVGYNSLDSDYNAIGNTGGSKTATLSANNLPPHTHGIPIGSGTGNGGFASQNSSGLGTTQTDFGIGTAAPVPTRPPFYTALYIMRIY